MHAHMCVCKCEGRGGKGRVNGKLAVKKGGGRDHNGGRKKVKEGREA